MERSYVTYLQGIQMIIQEENLICIGTKISLRGKPAIGIVYRYLMRKNVEILMLDKHVRATCSKIANISWKEVVYIREMKGLLICVNVSHCF